MNVAFATRKWRHFYYVLDRDGAPAAISVAGYPSEDMLRHVAIRDFGREHWGWEERRPVLAITTDVPHLWRLDHR